MKPIHCATRSRSAARRRSVCWRLVLPLLMLASLAYLVLLRPPPVQVVIRASLAMETPAGVGALFGRELPGAGVFAGRGGGSLGFLLRRLPAVEVGYAVDIGAVEVPWGASRVMRLPAQLDLLDGIAVEIFAVDRNGKLLVGLGDGEAHWLMPGESLDAALLTAPEGGWQVITEGWRERIADGLLQGGAVGRLSVANCGRK